MSFKVDFVATVLTVYGIETLLLHILQGADKVAIVLTVYGIETMRPLHKRLRQYYVATVLTVYGIETHKDRKLSFLLYSTYRLRY